MKICIYLYNLLYPFGYAVSTYLSKYVTESYVGVLQCNAVGSISEAAFSLP